MWCFGCGVEKDMAVLEDVHGDGDPVSPLVCIDCEPDTPRVPDSRWGMVVICNDCFSKLDPDMWIDERGWMSINPVVPFHKLPPIIEDRTRKWDPANYFVGE